MHCWVPLLPWLGTDGSHRGDTPASGHPEPQLAVGCGRARLAWVLGAGAATAWDGVWDGTWDGAWDAGCGVGCDVECMWDTGYRLGSRIGYGTQDGM